MVKIYLMVIILFSMLLFLSLKKDILKRDNTKIAYWNDIYKFVFPNLPNHQVINKDTFQLSHMKPIRNLLKVNKSVFDSIIGISYIDSILREKEYVRIYYWGRVHYNMNYRTDLIVIKNNPSIKDTLVGSEYLFWVNSVGKKMQCIACIAKAKGDGFSSWTQYSVVKNKQFISKHHYESDVIYLEEDKEELEKQGIWKEDTTYYSKFIFDDSGYLKFVE